MLGDELGGCRLLRGYVDISCRMPISVEPRRYYNCKMLDIKTVNFPERVYSECKEAAGGEVHQSPLTCDTEEEARSSEQPAVQSVSCLHVLESADVPVTFTCQPSTRSPFTGRFGIPRRHPVASSPSRWQGHDGRVRRPFSLFIFILPGQVISSTPCPPTTPPASL